MAERASLRSNRPETERLAVALLLSLAVHLAVWGVYVGGKKTGLWQHVSWPTWRQAAKKKTPAPPAQPALVDPTIFVDVSHADPEPPVRSKFYSNKNSRAANPDPANANLPRLTGRQKDILKTEDTPKFTKLEPSPPAPKPQNESAEAAKQEPGETRQRPTNQVAVAEKPTPATHRDRPRTLRQAQSQNSPQLPGEQMQQAGGVPRPAPWASLDVKSSAFGDYDRAIIESVTQRWYDLLDSRRFALDRTGIVTLHFRLKSDGTVHETQVVDNSVGELLGYVCQSAVEEAAPFGKWPPDMLRMIGSNFRDITFTFHYY